MEIWDGAELALIRETLRRLVEEEECRSLAVDMRYVKYVPSGFFGMLYDWYEKRICVRVLGPLPHVRQMLWFTKFFHSIGGEFHELRPCPEDEFCESILDRAPAQVPVTTADFPLTTQDARNSSVSNQTNEIADKSATAPPCCGRDSVAQSTQVS
jgi:hypothetical protein